MSLESTKEEIKDTTTEELLKLYNDTDSDSAYKQLLTRYDYILRSAVKRYLGKGMEYDDLYQSACIGFLHAVKNFDSEKDVKFKTYAATCVLGEIKHFCREKGNYIKVPRRIYEIYYRAKKINDSAILYTGSPLSSSDLAKRLCVSEEEVECALAWGNNRILHSLEQFICEGNDLVFSDILGIEDNSLMLAEDSTFINECLNHLTKEEQDFLKYRYYDEMSQTDIARIMSVSQMKISRMEKRVLSVLKDMYFN